MKRRFLPYLPASVHALPPVLLANDPYHCGGAWCADTCQKAVRFIHLAEPLRVAGWAQFSIRPCGLGPC